MQVLPLERWIMTVLQYNTNVSETTCLYTLHTVFIDTYTRFRQVFQSRAEPNSKLNAWKVWRLKQLGATGLG